MLPPAAPPMTPLNLSKPKTLEEMIAETNTKEHWDERGGAYAFVIIVPVAIGILMLVARRLDSKTHRASPHSGCQAVIAMAGDWEKQGVCWRIVGRAARLHSLSCVFMPPPRLLRRLEESIMLIGILVMSFANCVLLLNPHREHGEPPISQLDFLIWTIFFMTFFAFLFWMCRWLFIVGGTSTCCGAAARVGGWFLSAFLLVVVLCGWFIWSTMSQVTFSFAHFLGAAALYWFVMEPLTVLVISASMQFCACCKACCVGCGREPPESAPRGGELHELPVVAEPVGTI
jgi:hypothetical protein